MANTNETIADIRKDAEAKFRELVKAYMQRRAAFQTTVGAMQAFNTVFDRIEAAIKRERAKIEADALEVGGIVEAARKSELSKNMSKNGADFGQLGDAAKLREALMQAKELNDLWFDTFTLPDGATSVHDEIEDVISAALAAPPRNCDLPEVAKDPWRAWLDDKSNWDEFGSPNLEIHDWLLAPATEKEGGAK